jgi:hypothetical protein
MARPESEKKSEPTAPAERRVLPMELHIGDRLTDENGEWEIIGRPYTTNAGRDARVRVRRVGQPDVTEIRVWRAHERVSVKQANADGDKR